MVLYKATKDGKVEMTADEEASLRAEWKAWEDISSERKLTKIKEIRLQKLIETDYLANSDVTMPDNIKNFRQSMRDVPQNFSTKAEYDLLLNRNEQGQLTHTIWEKP